MKKFTTLKTLLVGLLALGATSVWAVEVTTTFDFSEATANPTISSSAHHKAGNSTNVFLATDDFCKSRLCFQAIDATNNVFVLRNGKLVNYKGDRWMSVVDLKAGDKVSFTFTAAAAGSSTDKWFTIENAGDTGSTNLSETEEGEAIAANTDIVTDQTYYVLADGYIDLKTRKNFFLSKVTITTNVDAETVSAPEISVTGAYNGARNVTLKTGESTLGGNVTNYYTIDGTNPTTSSASSTDQYKTITVGEGVTEESTVTVKAYCVSANNVASDVTTLEVPVGTTIQLNAPTYTLTGMTLNNTVYNPVYTLAAAQNVIGTPEATISYSFDGGSSITGTSFTAIATGTLTITASAEGYASNSTELVINDVDYTLTKTIDLSSDSYVDVSGFGTGSENAHWANFKDMSTTLYTLPENTSLPDVTINNVTYSQFGLGYGLGFASGTRTVTVNNAIEGQIGEFVLYTGGKLTEEFNASEFVVYSNGITFTIPTTGNSKALKKINVYSSSSLSVSATITSAGYATYYSPYALDFSSVEGLTAYTASVTGDKVTFTQVAKVPANTGVLLKGSAGKYQIPVVTDGGVATSELVGGTATAPAGSFVLMNENDKVGFYKTKAEFTLGANTAYIPAQGVAFVNTRDFIAIDGEATAIKAIETNKQGGEIFNLAGQRVNKAQKGLYIQNGKKVIIK